MPNTDLRPVYFDEGAYEQFNGRWSRISGRDFIAWLCLPNSLGAHRSIITSHSAPVPHPTSSQRLAALRGAVADCFTAQSAKCTLPSPKVTAGIAVAPCRPAGDRAARP